MESHYFCTVAALRHLHPLRIKIHVISQIHLLHSIMYMASYLQSHAQFELHTWDNHVSCFPNVLRVLNSSITLQTT